MFMHYLTLARQSLWRNRALTALMVLSIGLGIGACTTMLTVLQTLSGDPLPGQSAALFYPQLDPQDREDYRDGVEPPDQLTWIDAMNLLHAGRAKRQAAMFRGKLTVRPGQGDGHAFFASARYTSADFFAMFAAPFAQGSGWSGADDQRGARVAVIGASLARRLYGEASAVGRTLRLDGTDFRVIGVLGVWRPIPRFYDVLADGYGDSEQIYLPLSTAYQLSFASQGQISCWGSGGVELKHLETAPCVWLQFWVQLDSPAQRDAYRQFLLHYAQQQRTSGRFGRPVNVRLRGLMEWLEYRKVVPGSVTLQTQLAFAFLLVCLVNTTALMLVKFLRRGGELAVRRAMGASKLAVFAQLLIEALMVGLGGGVFGLLLAWCGLWVVRQQPTAYAGVVQMDAKTLPIALLLALATTLLAAVFPAWRACRLPPARLLKIQ
jgi:putative ABC transport system permease protein